MPPDDLDDVDMNGTHHKIHTSGLQVAVCWREEDQCWAIPGQFASQHNVNIMAHVRKGDQMTGDLPSKDSKQERDQARLVVRKIFELEGLDGPEVAERNSELLDEVFKKSSQTLIYRGISDDPRNTDEAWVETSAWHVHCPSLLAKELGTMYDAPGNANVQWLDVVIYADDGADDTERVRLYDARDGHRSVILTTSLPLFLSLLTTSSSSSCSSHLILMILTLSSPYLVHRYDMFASHRELIELAVFGDVLGHRDMPFPYRAEKDTTTKHADGSALKELAPLDSNHTHYICIDDGSNGSFGVAVQFRADLESFISYYDAEARHLELSELTDYFAVSPLRNPALANCNSLVFSDRLLVVSWCFLTDCL